MSAVLLVMGRKNLKIELWLISAHLKSQKNLDFLGQNDLKTARKVI